MNISSIKKLHPMPKVILYVCLALVSMNLIAQAPPTPVLQNLEPGQVSMSNWVDRTALFPGDSLKYHIEIRVDANMGILLDDIQADELSLTGLELISANIDEDSSDEGTSYHAIYNLATFQTGTATLRIDELRVRYYFRRPGQRLENVAAAGEIVVPAVSLALQSTLPADPASLGLRDMGKLGTLQGLMRGAGILGLILFLVSVIPLIILLTRRFEKSDIQQAAHDREEMIQETSAELLQLKKLDPNIPEQRLDGFNQIEHILKEYIENTVEIKATPLTSAELSKRVSALEPILPASEFEVILEACETARYGKPDNLPSADSFNKGLMFVQDLLTS
jgi:hypothetical protein